MDYPLARYNLKRYGKYFNKVLIAITDGLPHLDVQDFIRGALPDARFVRVSHHTGDWRNEALHELLLMSDAEYLLFMEQDFLIRDESFFEKVLGSNRTFVGFRVDGRIHPAFLLVRRSLLDQTSKDFSAHPPEHDHFGRITKELCSIVRGEFLDEMGLLNDRDYKHLSGLTQNYYHHILHMPFHQPVDFLSYNALCLKLKIAQHPGFLAIMQEIKDEYPFEESEVMKQFFPQDGK